MNNENSNVRTNISDVEVMEDGDVVIKGEQIKSLVKQEKITGIKAAIKNVKDFFKGIFNKQKDGEQR